MPFSSERLAGRVALKWLVGGVGLAACVLLASYDLRVGLAAGALMAVVATVWMYIAVRYGSLRGTPSVRSALVERSRLQAANRRQAERQSGAEQGADPAQRP